MIHIPGLDGSPVADGQIHRYAPDRRGKKNSWYVLHRHGDALYGAYGNWKTGETGRVHEGQLDRVQYAKTLEMVSRKRSDDGRQAAVAAELQWVNADAYGDSPYLVRKRVLGYGVRFEGDVVLVPMCAADGTLRGLQRIYPDGKKLFTRGCAKKGSFHTIEGDAVVVIAEGYATAASIHAATGMKCLVAFDCGNLEPVARSFRAINPGVHIVIAADNDLRTPGNPGLAHATAAAKAVRGKLVVADLGEHEGTDFNDVHVNAGIDEVARQIFGAL